MALTVSVVLRRSTEHLAARGVESPRVDAEHLLARALGLERIELYAHHDRPLTSAELDRARDLIGRRARREPLQYVLGEWDFRRLTLGVDRRALIPRPETETVVERALARLQGVASPTVLDVGTGTGAIALAIAQEHPGSRVTALDASTAALELATENAIRLGLVIDLVHHDIREGVPAGPWDLVVSNPPYVAVADEDGLAPEVRDWEPTVALFGEGMHEVIASRSRQHLRPGGAVVLEVGDQQAEAVCAALLGLGFRDAVITPDLAGRPRVVEATWHG